MTNNSFRLNIKPLLFIKNKKLNLTATHHIIDNFYYIYIYNTGYYLSTLDGLRYIDVTPNTALTAVINSKTLTKKKFLDKVKEVHLYLQVSNL
jgi:hypothetical protein